MTTRSSATCWVLVLGFALLVGCSGKSDHAGGFIDTSSNAGATTVGHAGSGGASGAGHGGSGGSSGSVVSVLAPKVEITAPTAASDPNVDAVLIEDQVTVLCNVTKSKATGALDVDPASVTIAMLGADGKQLKTSPGAATENQDEYSTSFVLGAVPTGAISFQCSASDKAEVAHASTGTVDTFLDHGPEISIVEPEDMSAHNLMGAMTVEFDTAPALLSAADKQADVSDVTLTVYGAQIATTAKAKGKYTASVNFADKAVFGAPPTGKIPLVLTASNNRKAPGKATQSVSYTITLDGTGPAIAIASPVANAVVGRPRSLLLA